MRRPFLLEHQMSSVQVKGEAKEATIEAVIIRADGTRVPLGVVSYWHRNPLKRWAWKVKQWAKARFK
jgi:hypothetical protein